MVNPHKPISSFASDAGSPLAAADLQALLTPAANANRPPAASDVLALLANGNRNIDVNKLVNQVRANGYVGVLVVDDARERGTGSHAAQMLQSLAAELPPNLKPFVSRSVRAKVISDHADDGRRDLTGALSQVRRLVDAGKVQVIVSAATLAEDKHLTLPALSQVAGRPITGLDQVRRSDLNQSLAQLSRQNPALAQELAQLQELAGRVPCVVAGGNAGVGSALSLAPSTISVGAENGDGTRAMNSAYFEAYASGLPPESPDASNPAPVKPGVDSSFAAPRVAGEFVKALARQAGL